MEEYEYRIYTCELYRNGILRPVFILEVRNTDPDGEPDWVPVKQYLNRKAAERTLRRLSSEIGYEETNYNGANEWRNAYDGE